MKPVGLFASARSGAALTQHLDWQREHLYRRALPRRARQGDRAARGSPARIPSRCDARQARRGPDPERPVGRRCSAGPSRMARWPSTVSTIACPGSTPAPGSPTTRPWSARSSCKRTRASGSARCCAATPRSCASAARSNVQDGSVVHADEGIPTTVGERRDDRPPGDAARLHDRRRLADRHRRGRAQRRAHRQALPGGRPFARHRGQGVPGRLADHGLAGGVVRALTTEQIEEIAHIAAHYVDNARRFARASCGSAEPAFEAQPTAPRSAEFGRYRPGPGRPRRCSCRW